MIIRSLYPLTSVAYKRQWTGSVLLMVTACRLVDAKLLTGSNVTYYQPLGTNFSKIVVKIHIFSFMRIHFKMACAKWRPFCPRTDDLNNNISLGEIPQSLQPAILYARGVESCFGTLRAERLDCILLTPFSNTLFNENRGVFINVLQNLLLECPSDYRLEFAKVTDWRRTADRPVPEPMITYSNDAYMCH